MQRISSIWIWTNAFKCLLCIPGIQSTKTAMGGETTAGRFICQPFSSMLIMKNLFILLVYQNMTCLEWMSKILQLRIKVMQFPRQLQHQSVPVFNAACAGGGVLFMLWFIAFSWREEQKDTRDTMMYAVLLMLIPLLCRVFFMRLVTSHPLYCNFLCWESRWHLAQQAGVAGGADVLPELGATAWDKREGGGDGCSVCARGSEREVVGEREREGAHDIPACKSLRTMSAMVCPHSQHKGERNTVTTVTLGRMLPS